jgi:hypothetical protein
VKLNLLENTVLDIFYQIPLKLSQINISNDYKKCLKSPKISTSWAKNVGFAPTHL